MRLVLGTLFALMVWSCDGTVGTGRDGGGGGSGGGSAGGGAGGGGAGGGGGGVLANGAPQVWLVCAPCHGMDGEGVSGATGGPEVQHANEILVRYFVRHGDDNIFVDQPGTGPMVQNYIGDTRTMPTYSTAAISEVDLNAIIAWLQGLPRKTTGAELYTDHCLYCHGPQVPNLASNGHDTRGAYYVKPQVSFADKTWTQVEDSFRNGFSPQLDPVNRRGYMPPFSRTLVTDAEFALIARWICGQYPSTVTVPSTGYCNHIP